MGRIFNVLLIAVMVVGALVTYNLKRDAEETANRVSRLHSRIAAEREEIALLKTEWSLLTQPSRLQALIGKYQDHFKLEPFSVSQVATLDEIPARAPETSKETTLAAAPDVVLSR